MTKFNGITTKDVLADGLDSREFNGKMVRKGTIKAAVENAKIYKSPHTTMIEKQGAKNMFKRLDSRVATGDADRF